MLLSSFVVFHVLALSLLYCGESGIDSTVTFTIESFGNQEDLFLQDQEGKIHQILAKEKYTFRTQVFQNRRYSFSFSPQPQNSACESKNLQGKINNNNIHIEIQCWSKNWEFPKQIHDQLSLPQNVFSAGAHMNAHGQAYINLYQYSDPQHVFPLIPTNHIHRNQNYSWMHLQDPSPSISVSGTATQKAVLFFDHGSILSLWEDVDPILGKHVFSIYKKDGQNYQSSLHDSFSSYPQNSTQLLYWDHDPSGKVVILIENSGEKKLYQFSSLQWKEISIAPSFVPLSEDHGIDLSINKNNDIALSWCDLNTQSAYVNIWSKDHWIYPNHLRLSPQGRCKHIRIDLQEKNHFLASWSKEKDVYFYDCPNTLCTSYDSCQASQQGKFVTTLHTGPLDLGVHRLDDKSALIYWRKGNDLHWARKKNETWESFTQPSQTLNGGYPIHSYQLRFNSSGQGVLAWEFSNKLFVRNMQHGQWSSQIHQANAFIPQGLDHTVDFFPNSSLALSENGDAILNWNESFPGASQTLRSYVAQYK
ncbi:MAG: hypothetical protein KDD52_00950 [Bdellovibrionales bacterium]|nr:hypothetical protein [Bdellovibrionales bacterium]